MTTQECPTCGELRAENAELREYADQDEVKMRALRQENERLEEYGKQGWVVAHGHAAELDTLKAELRQSREQTAAVERERDEAKRDNALLLKDYANECSRAEDAEALWGHWQEMHKAAEREASKLREDLVDAHGLIRSLRSGLKYVTASADHEEAVRWARSSLAHARAALTQGGGRGEDEACADCNGLGWVNFKRCHCNPSREPGKGGPVESTGCEQCAGKCAGYWQRNGNEAICGTCGARCPLARLSGLPDDFVIGGDK